MFSESDWDRIYDGLRESCLSGDGHVSIELDTKDYDTTCTSFQMAKDLLVAEGLVIEESSKLYIARRPARSQRSVSFVQDYKRTGRKPKISTLLLDIVPVVNLPENLAHLCQQHDHNLVSRHRHIQSVDGVPHAIAESFVPLEIIGDALESLRDGQLEIFDIFSRNQIVPSLRKESLLVDVPTYEEKQALGIAQFNRIYAVRIEGSVWAGDRLIEAYTLCDRADLYVFNYTTPIG